MATLEMVEKLRQHANVSYNEAKAALDACGDDLLEAMIYLEQQGKVTPPNSQGHYSTYREQYPQGENGGYTGAGGTQRGETFGETLRRFWRWICSVVHKGNTNRFVVSRGGAQITSLPVTLLVVLVLCAFWVSAPLIVIGLFCGCKYQFRGPNLDDSSVNNVMDSVANAADNIKNEVLNTDGEGRN